MTLPKDGFPRISSHGIECIQNGLKGDFTGWLKIDYMNHPYQLHQEDCANCGISASPDWYGEGKPQFTIQVWFGQYPLLNGMGMVPTIEFSEIDTLDYCVPPRGYVELKHRDDWYNHVLVAVDDWGLGKGNLVNESEDEEDEEEEQECECDLIQQVAKSKQTGLEAFL